LSPSGRSEIVDHNLKATILLNPLKKQPLPEGVGQIPMSSIDAVHEPIQQLMRWTLECIKLLRAVLKAQLTATCLQRSTDRTPGQKKPVRRGIPARTLAIELAERETIKRTSQSLLLPTSAAIGSEKSQQSFPGRAGQRHTVVLFQACPSSSPWPSLSRGRPTQWQVQRPGKVAGLESQAQAESSVEH